MSIKAAFGLVISYVILGLIIVCLGFGVALSIQRGKINNSDLLQERDNLKAEILNYKIKVNARDGIIHKVKQHLRFKKTALGKIQAEVDKWEILKQAERGGAFDTDKEGGDD